MRSLPGPGGIAAADLVKSYGDVRALDGLSFGAQAGTIFGLLGPNGAGKSTTVRILTTLSVPDSGSATVAGVDVVADPARARHMIGAVGQASAVDPNATGAENVALQATLHGLHGPARHARCEELLDRFGLAGAANRPAGTYSGGMQRKLDVVMGLVHRPSVLFLDEPTTGLDPAARAELWAAIGQLAADGMTILLTTHYLEEADRLATRVAIVDQGRVVTEGTPDELKSALNGDVVEAELTAPVGPAAVAALGQVPGLRDIVVDGRSVRAAADRGGALVPALVAALEAAGGPVASVTVARPTLDDVYLSHTGRRMTADVAPGIEVA